MAHWDSVSGLVDRPSPLVRTFDGLAVAKATAVFAASTGVALGFLTAADVRLATALTLAVLLGLMLIVRPSLLLPTLVAAVFVEVVSVGGVGVVPLLAPFALLALVAAASRPGLEIRAGPPLVWAFAYATWALASGLWTVSLGGTSSLLGSLAVSLVYLLCFAGLLNSERQLEGVLYAFTLAALVIGAFAIGAFALGFSNDLEGGRSIGGAGDPNIFAAYQVVTLPLAVVLATRVQKRWEKSLVYLAVIAIVGSVLTSVSRGGVLTLIAVTLILLVMPARSVFRSRGHKAIFATAAVVATVVSLAFTAGEIIPRFESVFRDDTAATAESRGSGRSELWATAWRSFHDRPFQGLGFGAFADVSNELIVQTPGVSLRHFELRPQGTEVHSVYLGSLAELGLVGLSLFLGLLLSTAVALRRTARQARAAGNQLVMGVANALLLSMFGFAVASAFLSTETSRPLWIVVGLSLALPKLLANGSSGRAAAPVRRPGLWRLPERSRSADAVERAGGATRAADLSLRNLAAPVADGMQVVGPAKEPAAAAGGSTAGGSDAAGASQGPVHLNTATLEELDALPGVGPVTAQKILDYREKHGAFTSVEDLDAIPGIGPARLEQLREAAAP